MREARRLYRTWQAVQTALFAFIAWAFFLYPAWVTGRAVFSEEIRAKAQSPSLVKEYRATAGRYSDWAAEYLQNQRATKISSHDVAGTEWPIFGSVFFLMTTEEVVKAEPKLLNDVQVRDAIHRAAQVVASPDTASWVKTKWGLDYLERENLFYRMLLIMGLGSFEQLTGSSEYAGLLGTQAKSLTAELLAAPHHLADDYPDECYPNDVLWAVASLKRAANIGYVDSAEVDRLSRGVFRTLNTLSMTDAGLPSFQVRKETGEPLQLARGSGNSGIIPLAAELDSLKASVWFNAYVDNYWKSGWVSGFQETPHGHPELEDVDSGPSLFGVGSVATGFGLGAARSVGRYDYAVPLAMETVAGSWPTPFGLLLPGVLGWAAADGWCFGELALHYSMTRPNQTQGVTGYEGGVPGMVWVFLLLYGSGAGLLLWRAWVCARRAAP